MVPLVTLSLGCSYPVGLSADPSSNARTDSPKAPVIFDAGVVFANEASYVCIPLDKLGIDAGQEIVSIESSCECVRPSVVHFLQRISVERVAIRLDFIKDSKMNNEINPVLLGVEINVRFASGAKQSATIQFLQTMRRGNEL